MSLRIFDFFCPNCGFTKEAFVNGDSEAKPNCLCCGAEMERLMPAPMWRWASGCRGF